MSKELISTSYNFRRPITQLRLYPGLSQLNMIAFLIYKLKSLFFLPDVNFDEYDKSDDPPDYKFVRWLTKEKVGRKTF